MRQVLISMRLPRETVEYFKAHYAEYTGGMREVLVKQASKPVDMYKVWMESDERKKAIAESEAIAAGRAGCEHEYAQETVGRCLTQYTCRYCGYSYEVDSSD